MSEFQIENKNFLICIEFFIMKINYCGTRNVYEELGIQEFHSHFKFPGKTDSYN